MYVTYFSKAFSASMSHVILSPPKASISADMGINSVYPVSFAWLLSHTCTFTWQCRLISHGVALMHKPYLYYMYIKLELNTWKLQCFFRSFGIAQTVTWGKNLTVNTEQHTLVLTCMFMKNLQTAFLCWFTMKRIYKYIFQDTIHNVILFFSLLRSLSPCCTGNRPTAVISAHPAENYYKYM